MSDRYFENKEPAVITLNRGDAAVVWKGDSPDFEVHTAGDYPDDAEAPQSFIYVTMISILFSGRPETNAIKDRLFEIMRHRPDPDAEPDAGSS